VRHASAEFIERFANLANTLEHLIGWDRDWEGSKYPQQGDYLYAVPKWYSSKLLLQPTGQLSSFLKCSSLDDRYTVS
jgi:hypothetical protein